MKIGTYKDKPIIISDLHYKYTYANIFCLNKDYLPTHHKEFFEEKIPERVTKYFGTDRSYIVIGLDKIDFSDWLPQITVYARLDKPSTAGDPIPGPDGQHLYLVWFQNEEENPFTKAIEILNTINWEEKAKDYEW